MSEEEYIYGRQPVAGYLDRNPRYVAKVFIRDSARGQEIEHIKQLSSRSRIPVQFVPGGKLNEMVGQVNDQGIVALITPQAFMELEDWMDRHPASGSPIVLMLDEIEDVNNFGAILRTAAAAGADGVIIGKHRQNPLTSNVHKASAGTAGLVPTIRVVNLNQTLLRLKEAGFWVAGLAQESDAPYWQQDLTGPLALVVGSESKGIRKKTLEHCDFRLSIPMREGVESLNASVSAALALYEALRQRKNNE